MYKNLILLSISAALSLLIAEWVITWATADPGYIEAQKRGLNYDKRDRLEVILHNRKKDPNWFPAVPANTYLERHLYLSGIRIIPLSGVANANIVGCNENGYFNFFRTDEIGFRNPPGTWPLQPRKHIYLVGDSFTQGDCVNDEYTIAGILRRDYPEVINLGVGGNGPLLELASIREYVLDRKVSYVFWLYYEGNDLNDLLRDYGDEILRRYLEPGFNQSLLDKQHLVNSLVRTAIEQRISEQASSRPIILPKLRELLWRLRYKHDHLAGNAKYSKTHNDLDMFINVIKLANNEVKNKGGQFVFVYLPEYNRLSGDPISKSAKLRNILLHRLAELEIPVIDTQNTLLSHPSPESLLPFGLRGRHYTTEGYAYVASAIKLYLDSKHPKNTVFIKDTP